MRTLKILLLAGAMAGVTAMGAVAAGSGGGGSSGSMPSASGPSYDPAAEYRKAVEALQAKNYKAAARAAGNVTEAAPKDISGWRILGVAQAGAENWKAARKAYERAIKIDPNDLTSRAGLGVALARLQDAKAQEQLDWLKARASGCGTGCPDATNIQKLTAEVEGAMSSSARKPAAALEQDRPMLFAGAAAGDAAYVQAVSLINEKRYDEALASLEAAKAVFGPHPDILTYQGYTWRKKGAFDRAEGYYKEALAVAPDHRGATEYYGELKVEQGDIAGAKLMLARLDRQCAFGCAEAEELRRWIDAGAEPK